MNEIAIASLLHDIGKFAQRAKGVIGRTSEGKSHPDYSKSFITEYSAIFSNPAFIAKMCANHHAPKEKEEKIIQLADWLSSAEREEMDEGETSSSWEDPQISIFSQLKCPKTETNTQKDEDTTELNYSLLPLIVGWRDSRNNLMGYPTKNPDVGKDFYKALWNSFVEEIKMIKKKDDLETIFFLLQKYCSFVPSATRWGMKGSLPDVSLFDHLKTTCAIACCLDAEKLNVREYDEIIDGLKKEKGEILSKKHFLLVSGDISGIQSFIYQISSKGAAKALKGRSFYIQLLSEIVARCIVDELGLPIANILYCGGGHFYILVASQHENKLKELKKKINEILLHIHNGDLYFTIEWLPLSIEDFYLKGITNRWEDVSEKVNNAKKKKFSEIISENSKEVHKVVFGPYEEGGTKHTCDSCGRESEEFWYKDEKNIWRKGWSETEDIFCDFCKSMIDLTDDLLQGDYLQIIKIKNSHENPEGIQQIFSTLGYIIKFHASQDSIENDGLCLRLYKGDNIEPQNAKDFYIIPPLFGQNINCSFGFKFVPVVFPLENGKIVSFDDVVKKAKGTNRLGIARMDVDNLGKIFKEGLGNNNTISRISTLSRMFSLFFEGYVPYIINKFYYDEKNKKIRGNAYLVYSGGDDVFVIAPWNEAIDLLDTIYSQFRLFTAKRKCVTLSAGLAMVPAKYPIYKGAELAKGALEKSKKMGKNRICIFDSAFEWDIGECEFNKVKELRNTVCDTIEKTSRGLLSKLSQLHYILSPEELEEGRIDIQRIWMLYYYINRYGKKYANVKENLNKIKESFDEMIKIQPQDKNRAKIMIIPVALKWAELLTREKKE